ncbi:MAG: hypothetical protein KDC38_18815 [Planctomycetes bacterium]|nr:hypothetical protein [Planctomycetota bacterium]
MPTDLELAAVYRRDRRIYVVLLIVLVALVVHLSLKLRDMTSMAQSLRDQVDLEEATGESGAGKSVVEPVKPTRDDARAAFDKLQRSIQRGADAK